MAAAARIPFTENASGDAGAITLPLLLARDQKLHDFLGHHALDAHVIQSGATARALGRDVHGHLYSKALRSGKDFREYFIPVR